MFDKKMIAALVVGAVALINMASPALAQGYNQQQANAAQQQANYNYAAAQDAWATHTVPGNYPGGYNDGTKSYNFNGSITLNGYGLTPSENGYGQPAAGNGYGNANVYNNGMGYGNNNAFGNSYGYRNSTRANRRKHIKYGVYTGNVYGGDRWGHYHQHDGQ